MGKSIFKTIIIIFSGILFAALCFFIAQDHFAENRRVEIREQHYSQINNTINELYNRRNILNEKVKEISAKSGTDIHGLSTFTFVVGSTKEELVNDVKSRLDERQMKANLLLTPDSFANREGYIGTDRIKDLTDEDWEICISASSAEEVKNVVDLLKDNELPRAAALLLWDGINSKEIMAQASMLGIRVIFAGPENADRENTSFTWISIYGYRNADNEARVADAVSNSKTVALYISPESADGKTSASAYNEQSFASVLSLLDGYSKSGGCKVTVQSEAAERYIKRNDAIKKAESEAGESLEELEAEIDEVNARIKAIHEATY